MKAPVVANTKSATAYNSAYMPLKRHINAHVCIVGRLLKLFIEGIIIK